MTAGTGLLAGYLRFLAWLVAIAVGLLAAGYFPTRALGGPEAINGMFFGCLVSFIASLLGSLPLLKPGVADTGALLASQALRLVAVVALAAALAFLAPLEPRSFLIWVALAYPVFLVADIRYALARLRQAPPRAEA